MKRTAMLVTVTLFLVLAVGWTAWAAVWKTGTKYCSPQFTPATRAYSSGTTEHLPPGSGYRRFENGAEMRVTRWYAFGDDGGSWMVIVTGGALDDPGTYAYCSSIG